MFSLPKQQPILFKKPQKGLLLLQKNRNKREKGKKFSAVLREPKTRKVREETLAETHT
jgi:hypothetical protein